MSISFATTLHDPENRLFPLIKLTINKLLNISKEVVVCITNSQNSILITFLKSVNVIVIIDDGIKVVNPYSKAIRFCVNEFSAKKIFCIDFDRLIHWINTYPQELEYIIQNADAHDLNIVGRTKRAYDTHPSSIVNTEIIINQILSNLFNKNKIWDFLCANWIITKELARGLLSLQMITSTGFYGYWVYHLLEKTKSTSYYEVEGHEFETPDRYEKEINELGYDKWFETLDLRKHWERRVNILKDFVTEFQDKGSFSYELH